MAMSSGVRVMRVGARRSMLVFAVGVGVVGVIGGLERLRGGEKKIGGEKCCWVVLCEADVWL